MAVKATRDKRFFEIMFKRMYTCNYTLVALENNLKRDPAFRVPQGTDFLQVAWGFKILLRENELITVRIQGPGIVKTRFMISILRGEQPRPLKDLSMIIDVQPHFLCPLDISKQIRNQNLGGLEIPCCCGMGVPIAPFSTPPDYNVQVPVWDFSRFLFEKL